MDFDDHVVLVTGGSRGIGLATATRFREAGARLVIAGRSEKILKSAAERVGHGDRVRWVAADVSTVAGCEATVQAALDAFGRLDVLFTNAGSYESAPLGEVTEQLWDQTIDTHLKGTFFCVQAAAPALRAARGAVVTMASDAGLLGFRGGWAAYCAAMGGVVNLTRQLAVDLAPDVRVNAVAPGPINTPLVRGLSPEWRKAKAAELPLGRFGEPEEVAAAIAFLCSDQASLFVGQTVGPNSGDVML